MCNREAASVEAAKQRWAGQVEFVGVAWTGTDDEFSDFVARHGLTFPSLSDDAATVYDRFGIPYQPAIVTISPDGDVQSHQGAADDARIDELVTSAMG